MSIIGVCLDVSGSMESAWSLDRSQTADVERTHAIFTSLVNIVKREVWHHNREEMIFVSVFGVQNVGSIQTCDLVALLDHFYSDIDSRDWKDELIRLARRNNAGHTEEWITKYISKIRAKILCIAFRDDRQLLREMLDKIPHQSTMIVGKGISVVQDTVDAYNPFRLWSDTPRRDSYGERVHNSDAYKFSDEILDKVFRKTISTMETPRPRPVQEVSQLLHTALQLPEGSTPQTRESKDNLHKRVTELIEPIKPYILGRTPMCKALTQALGNFKQAWHSDQHRVLFLLSDGAASDGDPQLVAKKLQVEANVSIITCYLTSERIDNPKRLLDSLDTRDRDKKKLFEMSSTMKNTRTPITYLVDAGWELPPSGESRLFVQANSLEVVNEFCRIVVSHMDQCCDAIVNLLEKPFLAEYINQQNTKFKPKDQGETDTCYANAIAAVFNLAMMRVIGREVPKFNQIRDKLIEKYGEHGEHTKKVISEVCKEYRLQYRELANETQARQAINNRRPVVARFELYDDQWDKFADFYEEHPKEVLEQKHVLPTNQMKPLGHAVVLIDCDPNYLTFMNSWGQEWGSGGFFRAKDAKVFNKIKFYDIFWTEDDLTPHEKHAYKKKCSERAKSLMDRFPSIGDVEYECPCCKRKSKVSDYKGHVLQAECPRCNSTFKPKNQAVLESLYCSQFC